MATFVIGRPIDTTVPVIDVDPGLPVGRHRFQLEVVTSDRRVSLADVAEVEVIDLTLPPRRIPTDTILQPTDPIVFTRPVISPIRTPPIRPRTPIRPIDGE